MITPIHRPSAPAASLPEVDLDQPVASRNPQRVRLRKRAGFTLIELLVVISIIGVLAGLIVGLTGLATRKSRESRVRIEMSRLINDIENYKANLGSYPPDSRAVVNGVEISIPSPNPLFYELSGTIYTNAGGGTFSLVGRREPMTPAVISSIFGNSGFANAARDPRDLKFNSEFKASQFKRVIVNGNQIDVLAVPVPGVKGAGSRMLPSPNTTVLVNPWLYVSTNPTNNAERFDLWAEVIINGKLMRFSNWEKDPVVLSP